MSEVLKILKNKATAIEASGQRIRERQKAAALQHFITAAI